MGRRPAARSPMRRRLLPALLLAALASCASRVPITLASDPPGAEVWVNGRESGLATPCVVELDDGDDYEVQLRLPGYVPATRRIVEGGEREAIYWREMSAGTRTWDFPLFLNIHDFFRPAPVKHRLVPQRIFVRLRREADDA